jgi:alpha-amylase/alpha-mannosidase (GH57 family)
MHGIKDYWDMVRILDDFPRIRQTFNFTPSLLEQLKEYVQNGIADIAYDLSLKNPESFTTEDKVQALKTFFLANIERMVKRYPAYANLLEKRGIVRNEADYKDAIRNFTPQDFRDLQVWWNLSWVGEYSRFDPPFRDYLDKQRNFTEDEKSILLKSQLEILRRIVPHHIRAANRGQIEVSVSPFYHPILPLLCDSESGTEANPDTRLPGNRFSHPEDANEQIKSGLAYAEKTFGAIPRGIWPSEGSVSDAALDLLTGNKVEWTATDEVILQKTLLKAGKEISVGFVERFFAYDYKSRGRHLKVFFRDHALSDLIGFAYSRWSPDDAANDLVTRLLKIRDSIHQHSGEAALSFAVVPIILDGENAWEFYQSDGKDFLRTLYHKLSGEPRIKTVLPSGVKVKRGNVLEHIEPGSWINGDFKVWIGHPEDNKAWSLLAQARDALQKASRETSPAEKSKAYKEIMIAEGSDWCWWYGDEHKSPQADQFDNLFRYHLRKVYDFLGTSAPAELDTPIKQAKKHNCRQATRAISPRFHVREHDREWENAGFMEQVGSNDSMQRTGALVKCLYFGNDLSNIYLRIDTARKVTDERIVINFLSDPKTTIEIGKGFVYRREGSSKDCEFAGRCFVDETVQVALKLGGVKPTEVALIVSVYKDDELIDSFPAQGTAVFRTVQ